MSNMGELFVTYYRGLLSDPDICNCIKCNLALAETRTGLKTFVENTMNKIKDSFFKSVTICDQCCTENIIPCYTWNVCSGSKANCKFHATPEQMYKYCKKCETIFKEIEQIHRYEKPSWKITNAKRWSTDFWAIAKCFLPPDGYRDANSFDETDFNGIINIMINCKEFEQHFSFPFAEGSDLLQQARQIGRNIRHCSTFRVNEEEKTEVFKVLMTILSEPVFASYNGAKIAIKTLSKLDKESVSLERNYCKNVIEEILLKVKQSLVRELSDAHGQISGNDDDVLFESRQTSFLKESILHYIKSYENVNVYQHIRRFVSLKDIFVNPCIHKLQPMTSLTANSSRKGKQITSYNDLFSCEADIATDIYLYGPPGVGKTTLCKMIVLEWCYRRQKIVEVQQTPPSNEEIRCRQLDTTNFTDRDFLDKFDFIFPIFLHRSQGFCDVDEMIMHLNVDHFSQSSSYTQDFLQRILEDKRCLVILDGLDEWKHPPGCSKGHSDVPHRKTRTRCTILTTTRYENLTTPGLNPSIEMQMKNFNREASEQLIERVFSVVETSRNGLERFQDITKIMTEGDLRHFYASPSMIMQVIGLCLEGRPVFKCRSEVYTAMLAAYLENAESKQRGTMNIPTSDRHNEMPLPQLLFENKTLKRYHQFIILLSKFAFQITLKQKFLFCFDELLCEKLNLSKEVASLGRVSGIFVDYSDSMSQSQNMAFVDKYYQEFFCAIHLSCIPKSIECLIESATDVHLSAQINSDFASLLGAIESPLIFVGGLNWESQRYICDALTRKVGSILHNNFSIEDNTHTLINLFQNIQLVNKCIVSSNEESLRLFDFSYGIEHVASVGWKFKTDMKIASKFKKDVKSVLFHMVRLDDSYNTLIVEEPEIQTVWLSFVIISEIQELIFPNDVRRIALNTCKLHTAENCDFSRYTQVISFKVINVNNSITLPNSKIEECVVKYTALTQIEVHPFTSALKLLKLSNVQLNKRLDLTTCKILTILHLDNVNAEGKLEVNTSLLEECVFKNLSSGISTTLCSILKSAQVLKKLNLTNIDMDHESSTLCGGNMFLCSKRQTHLNLSGMSTLCELIIENISINKVSVNGNSLCCCIISELKANTIIFGSSFGGNLQTLSISNTSDALCQQAFQYLDPSNLKRIHVSSCHCQELMTERIHHMTRLEEIDMSNVDISDKSLKIPEGVKYIRLAALTMNRENDLFIPSSTKTIQLIGIRNIPCIDLKHKKLNKIEITSGSISSDILKKFVKEISDMGSKVECVIERCGLEDKEEGTLNFRFHNGTWFMEFISCDSKILPTILQSNDKVDTIRFDGLGDKNVRPIETALLKFSKLEFANCCYLDNFNNFLKNDTSLNVLAFENMILTDHIFQGIERNLNQSETLVPCTYLSQSIRNVHFAHCTFTVESLKKNIFNVFQMKHRIKFTLHESFIQMCDNKKYHVKKCSFHNTRTRI